MTSLTRWFCKSCNYESARDPKRRDCPICFKPLQKREVSPFERLNQDEIIIIRHLAEGRRIYEIAKIIGWKDNLVKRYLQEARHKTETKTNAELIAACMRAHVIQ